MKPLYRADIDGLRAVAVLSVVLFHFEITAFSGGFVGVDIFFVISGFLISKIILAELQERTFTFKKFYFRRLKRLFPAYFLMLLLSFFVAAILYSPADLKSLSESIFYSLFSLSNVLFWSREGYFDVSSQVEPLLHTWSLSVEEQFYMLWPALLMLCVGGGENRRYSFYLTIAVLGGSALYITERMIDVDAMAAFYLTPFRVSEFCLGAVCAFGCKSTTQLKVRAEVLSLIGLGLITYSIFAFDEQTRFPGVNAFIPCLGAMLIILFGERAKALALLKAKYIVYIGLISYSMYLLHWPLWVFVKYWKGGDIGHVEKIGLMVMLVMMSFISYRYVETPFRKAEFDSKPTKYAFVCTSLALLLTLPVINAWTTKGWLWRLSDEARQYSTNNKGYHKKEYGGQGYKNKQKIGKEDGEAVFVLIGDSHGKAYVRGLDELLRKNNKSAYINITHACLNLPGIARVKRGVIQDKCIESLRSKTRQIEDSELPLVIAQRWGHYYNQIASYEGEMIMFEQYEEYIAFIRQKLEEFKSDIAHNRRVILIGAVSETQTMNGGVSCVMRPSLLAETCEKNMGVDLSEINKILLMNKMLREFSESQQKVDFVDPIKYLCGEDKCDYLDKGKLIYSDRHHLSKHGSRLFANKISKTMFNIN